MYNENTANDSFLKMSRILKIMGIKNNMFMLEQKDETIPDNPHEYGLDKADQDKIIEECKNNIWYFLREVVRIPSNFGGGSPSRFILNPANMAMIYFLEKGVNIYSLGTRQASNKTFTTLLYLIWNLLKGKYREGFPKSPYA
jgi:hypothetical protein